MGISFVFVFPSHVRNWGVVHTHTPVEASYMFCRSLLFFFFFTSSRMFETNTSEHVQGRFSLRVSAVMTTTRNATVVMERVHENSGISAD